MFDAGLSTFGSTRTANCASGYAGSARFITCQAEGSWTQNTGCALGDCGVPSSLSGYMLGSGNTYVGSTYSVACAAGYIGSPSSLTCQSTFVWSSFAGCTMVDCGLPIPGVGYELLPGSVTTYNSLYGLSCAAGYGGTAANVTCQASGEWTLPAGCSEYAGSSLNSGSSLLVNGLAYNPDSKSSAGGVAGGVVAALILFGAAVYYFKVYLPAHRGSPAQLPANGSPAATATTNGNFDSKTCTSTLDIEMTDSHVSFGVDAKMGKHSGQEPQPPVLAELAPVNQVSVQILSVLPALHALRR